MNQRSIVAGAIGFIPPLRTAAMRAFPFIGQGLVEVAAVGEAGEGVLPREAQQLLGEVASGAIDFTLADSTFAFACNTHNERVANGLQRGDRRVALALGLVGSHCRQRGGLPRRIAGTVRQPACQIVRPAQTAEQHRLTGEGSKRP